MTARCAWCGEAVPKRARGRPGARAFCRKERSAAFYAAARAAYEFAMTGLPPSGAPIYCKPRRSASRELGHG